MIDLLSLKDLRRLVSRVAKAEPYHAVWHEDVRAYKVVTASRYGLFRHLLEYTNGKTLEENIFDIDANKHCSNGIHVATKAWCKDLVRLDSRASNGQALIIALQFTVIDVAAFPHHIWLTKKAASEDAVEWPGKFRLRRCKVVS